MSKGKDKQQENSPEHWQIPAPAAADHKYSRGHVLVYGGEVMTGASRLSALAALRIGAGLVTLAAPEKVWPIYAASLLSVIARPLKDMQAWQKLLEDSRINAVVIGPGAGEGEHTVEAIAMATEAKKNLVLDADALHVLAADESLRKKLIGLNIVCTPHEGEYALLARALRLDTKKEKPERALDLATALQAVVILKGAETIIAAPDGHSLINRNAPPFLATAGTGDVLAGMVAGLIAQGMKSFDAAAAAVWLHGEAASHLGRGLIAEDLPGAIPAALRGVSEECQQ